MITSVVLLTGQLGVVIAGFIGVASAVNWYHEGGKKDGPSNRKLPNRNV